MSVFIFASLSWVISARKWFKGPVKTVEDRDGIVGEFDEKGARVEEKSVESH